MSVEIIAFIFGCILVLIGIIGGGMEIKELKVPTISWPTRIIAIIGGVVFIGFGVELPSSRQEEQSPVQGVEAPVKESHSSPVAPVVQNQVEFRVEDELGLTQISEDIRILIQDRLAASLPVYQQRPKASATITVPRAGSYTYTVLADSIFEDQFGQIQRDQARGDGVIEVSVESVFGVTYTPHGIRLLPR
jgi:hypothetical protein